MSDCIEFDGYLTPTGYGVKKHQGKNYLRHRLEWILKRSPIPNGLYVLHTCHNRACYNIDHLYLGDQRRNMLDARDHNGVSGQKLTAEDVRTIRQRYADGDGVNQIAKDYDVLHPQISRIVHRKRWVDLDAG